MLSTDVNSAVVTCKFIKMRADVTPCAMINAAMRSPTDVYRQLVPYLHSYTTTSLERQFQSNNVYVISLRNNHIPVLCAASPNIYNSRLPNY